MRTAVFQILAMVAGCSPRAPYVSPPPDETEPPRDRVAPGRVWLVPWPPASGVVEVDATSTLVGERRSSLGSTLLRLPDVDGDGWDELYAWSDGPLGGERHGAIVVPLGSVSPGEQPIARAVQVRRAIAPGALADATGDGVLDLLQPVDGSEPAGIVRGPSDSVLVLDGTTLGTGAGAIPADDAVAVIDLGGRGFGRVVGGLGDLDGQPGEEVFVGRTFTLSGAVEGVQVDLYGAAELAAGLVNGSGFAVVISAGTVGAAGDVTGDGVPDLWVGEPHLAFGSAEEAGALAVVDGGLLHDGATLDADDASVRVLGTLARDRVGGWTRGLPDLDGDGLDELLLETGRDAHTLIFRGADLAGGRDLTTVQAAVTQADALRPEVLPDLDDDGVPEIGAWDADAFVVWSGATVPVAAGGTLDDGERLGACAFRDFVGWAGGRTSVAFVHGPDGWLAAFGASGAP